MKNKIDFARENVFVFVRPETIRTALVDKGRRQVLTIRVRKTLPNIRSQIVSTNHDRSNGLTSRNRNGHTQRDSGTRKTDDVRIECNKIARASIIRFVYTFSTFIRRFNRENCTMHLMYSCFAKRKSTFIPSYTFANIFSVQIVFF